MSTMKGFTTNHALVGTRVEISPATDLWMRGAMFGEIEYFNPATNQVKIRMDHWQVKRLHTSKVQYVKDLKTRKYFNPVTLIADQDP